MTSDITIARVTDEQLPPQLPQLPVIPQGIKAFGIGCAFFLLIFFLLLLWGWPLLMGPMYSG